MTLGVFDAEETVMITADTVEKQYDNGGIEGAREIGSTGLKQTGGGTSIFNNHIVRSKWNWQFTKELSLRFIAQYDALLVNPALTGLVERKNFNADVLLTYLVNPWTAFFVGYNSNARVLDPNFPGRFTNDAKQFFAKFSYLVRL